MYLSSKETLPRSSRGNVHHVPRVSFTGVDQSVGAGGHLNYIDISPTDTKTINDKLIAKTLPRTSTTNHTKFPSKIFASPENFKLSVRSLSQSSRSIISSSPEFLRKHKIHEIFYDTSSNVQLRQLSNLVSRPDLTSVSNEINPNLIQHPTTSQYKIFQWSVKRFNICKDFQYWSEEVRWLRWLRCQSVHCLKVHVNYLSEPETNPVHWSWERYLFTK